MGLKFLERLKKEEKKIVEKTPDYHSSLKTITVYIFHQILETGDTSLLYINEKGKKDLYEVWYDIYDQYCRDAKVDNRTIKQLSIIKKLEEKYFSASELLLLTCDEFPEVSKAAKEALKTKGYIFRNGQPFIEEYKRLEKQISLLKTKIAIEKNKLPKEQEKEAVKLMEQVIALENIFPDNKREIDIYTMTMEKWNALNKMGNEKVLAQRAMMNKKRDKR